MITSPDRLGEVESDHSPATDHEKLEVKIDSTHALTPHPGRNTERAGQGHFQHPQQC